MFKNKKTIILLTMIITSIMIYPLIFGKTIIKDEVSYNSTAPDLYQFESNKYTQIEDDYEEAINEFINEEEYKYIGTNDKNNLSIYLNEEDLSFIIKNLETNYIWSSKIDTSYIFDEDSPLHDEGDIGFNNFQLKRMKSPIVISYFINEIKREEGLFDQTASSFTKPNIINSNNEYGFESTLRLVNANISLKLKVVLNDDGLNVEIPFESIKEHGTNKLSNIIVYPYFGATKRDRIKGYTFIPDGVGALIRYDDVKKGIYNKRFFGNDIARNHSSLSEEMLYANLYGVVHGVEQNGFINIVYKGSTYASLLVNTSRNEDDFNKTYVSFEYRVLYNQYLNSSKTESVKLVQKDLNQFDIKMNYKFLSNEKANYIGMANEYKNYLNLLNENNLKSDISLHLNVLAAENKPTLFGKKTFSMTKIKELEEILKDLNSSNISNIDVTYHGWYNKGFSNSNTRYKNVNKKIGSKKDLKKLLEEYNNIYLSVDYTHANTKSKGFNSKDVLQSINKELITVNDQYLLNTTYALKNLNKDFKAMNKLNINNLDFNNLSKTLTSDFSKNGKNREEVVKDLIELMSLAEKTSIAKPYSFLWNSNIIYDIPLYSSNQAKFSDTVPFIPLVLNEKVVYGRASNFFSNAQNELLRMVDYNIYPSFYITKESSNLLLNTNSNHIYTSRYEDWNETINEQYQYLNNALKHVINKRLLNREVLKLGLVKNTYEDGTIIFINYSNEVYTHDNILINPTSYEVIL